MYMICKKEWPPSSGGGGRRQRRERVVTVRNDHINSYHNRWIDLVMQPKPIILHFHLQTLTTFPQIEYEYS